MSLGPELGTVQGPLRLWSAVPTGRELPNGRISPLPSSPGSTRGLSWGGGTHRRQQPHQPRRARGNRPPAQLTALGPSSQLTTAFPLTVAAVPSRATHRGSRGQAGASPHQVLSRPEGAHLFRHHQPPPPPHLLPKPRFSTPRSAPRGHWATFGEGSIATTRRQTLTACGGHRGHRGADTTAHSSPPTPGPSGANVNSAEVGEPCPLNRKRSRSLSPDKTAEASRSRKPRARGLPGLGRRAPLGPPPPRAGSLSPHAHLAGAPGQR